jgi:hypothetical protein
VELPQPVEPPARVESLEGVHHAAPVPAVRRPLSTRALAAVRGQDGVRLQNAAWVVMCTVVVVLLERLRAPQTFFFDDWDYVVDRRRGVRRLLEPHNGHLTALPTLVYRVLLSTFGMDHYRPYRVVALLVHAGVATGAAYYVRARIGWVAGASAGAAVLLLGSGWQNIFWSIQITWTGTVAAAILTWIALDRQSRASTAVATAGTVAALMCTGVGVAVLAGTAARLAAERAWRRLAVVAGGPALLFALWYVAYGDSTGTSTMLRRVPVFVVDLAAGGVGGLFGRSDTAATVLLVAVTAGVGFAVARRRPRAAFLAPLVCLGVNWILTSWSRAGFEDPASSRYMYVGAVFVILIVADALRDVRAPFLPAAAVVLAVLSVWGNWRQLHDGAEYLRGVTAVTRAELRAMEWARSDVDPAYNADSARMPQLLAHEYFDAVDEFGSPAATDGEVGAAAELARAHADRVSLEALSVGLEPAPGDVVESCSTPAPAADGRVSTSFEVITETTTTISAAATSPVEVRLRRYADEFQVVPLVVPAGETRVLRIGADLAPRQTWVVQIDAAATGVAVCGATGR